jgi:hypothetical protein
LRGAERHAARLRAKPEPQRAAEHSGRDNGERRSSDPHSPPEGRRGGDCSGRARRDDGTTRRRRLGGAAWIGSQQLLQARQGCRIPGRGERFAQAFKAALEAR